MKKAPSSFGKRRLFHGFCQGERLSVPLFPWQARAMFTAPAHFMDRVGFSTRTEVVLAAYAAFAGPLFLQKTEKCY